MHTINGGLVLTIALPAFAIAASVGAAITAFVHGDPTLPDEYHWEGLKLDHDFADAERAAGLNVRAAVALPTNMARATCRVSLQLNGPVPRAVVLTLIHSTQPDLDRTMKLTTRGGAYEAPCGPVPAAHWHVQLADEAGTWSVRQDVSGALDNVTITAR